MARFVYSTTITNPKTGESILLQASDRSILESKVYRKQAVWERQNQRLTQLEAKEAAIQRAERQSREAQEEIMSYRLILKKTLNINDQIDLEALKDTKPYKEYAPIDPPKWETFAQSIPSQSIFEFISYFKTKRLKAEEHAKIEFEKAKQDYEKKEHKNNKEYEAEKASYLEQQTKYNARLEKTKIGYEKAKPEGVQRYFSLVLERSQYPDSLDLYSAIHYEPHAKILLVDMEMPSTDTFPNVKEYKYIHAKREINETKMGKNEFEDFYNDTLYQITLRTLHEIFESDYKTIVDLVVFNGWVKGIDPRTGQNFKNCIISIQVSREQFLAINLEKISAKECFRHLKGVSAGSLVNLAPIKPIMVMNQEDKRFITADNIMDNLGESTNLATMDWQQFEVLVRDLIGKEFSSEGCKVEVTRASRDAGVDAIAFDQDPIRGGKYIIQAKRYNNLVPVSAVRDLYGTVHSEGAVKGILITTSYYGKDSLEFANGKPLKLINGEELLYMFNKHGYQFRIELTKKQKAMSAISY